jgi:hypothetical protein
MLWSFLLLWRCGHVPAFSAQGLLPNYIKVVPSIAIAFVTYEKLKEGLGVELRISS